MNERRDMFPGGRRAPKAYQDILAHFGCNLYGEHRLRLIWLPARCYVAGGWWEDRHEFAYRLTPKYAVTEGKWAMEKWLPASHYGNPWTWEQQTLSAEGFLQLGPFPAHGEYECVAVFSTGRGWRGFVPLEPGAVELQARLVHAGRVLRAWDIRNALATEEEARERARDEAFDVLWEERHYTRRGLTIGPGGHYDPAADVAAMRQRLLARRDLWQPQAEFRPGFAQEE